MRTRYFMPVLLIFTMVLSASVAVSGQDSIETRFQQANENYSRGNYQQAIGQYLQIIKESGYSVAVLANLANSYVQSGETGKAVLNYERALRLAPSDSDIKSNLNMVRKNNGLFPKDPAWSERIAQILTINQWTIMALIALLFCILSQLFAIKSHITKKVSTGIAITSVVIFGLATSATAFHNQYFDPSVVISPKARLLVSPFTSSASIGIIRAGRLLYPEKSHGDYVYVTDETNRKGWIHSHSIEAVCKVAPSHNMNTR